MYYRGDNDWLEQQSLQHWKYIKKKRVNGKWRYYYDVKDALGYDERQTRDDAAKDYEKATKEASKFQDQVSRENGNEIKSIDPYTGQPEYFPGGKERIEDRERQKADKFREAIAAGKAASAAQQEFAKTPLGKIENFTNKVSKAKKWLKKALNIN